MIELKEALVDAFCQDENPYIELYSVAHSWVLFERLIYKNVVKSHNQRYYLAACLKISVKLYELFGDPDEDHYKDKIEKLNEDMFKFISDKSDSHSSDNERGQDFTQRINEYEKKLLIALHFEPRVPYMLVWPHIESIQVMCDKTLEEFLGSDDYSYYMERVKVKV